MGRPIGLRRAVVTSADVISRRVTCTVVSVIPYMLTRRGVRSPCRANQPFRVPGSSASPAKMTSRRDSSAGSCGASAAEKCTKADGVWLRTVTPSARTSSRYASASRAVPSGTTTSRPPCSRAPHSSHTDTSNA